MPDVTLGCLASIFVCDKLLRLLFGLWKATSRFNRLCGHSIPSVWHLVRSPGPRVSTPGNVRRQVRGSIFLRPVIHLFRDFENLLQAGSTSCWERTKGPCRQDFGNPQAGLANAAIKPQSCQWLKREEVAGKMVVVAMNWTGFSLINSDIVVFESHLHFTATHSQLVGVNVIFQGQLLKSSFLAELHSQQGSVCKSPLLSLCFTQLNLVGKCHRGLRMITSLTRRPSADVEFSTNLQAIFCSNMAQNQHIKNWNDVLKTQPLHNVHNRPCAPEGVKLSYSSVQLPYQKTNDSCCSHARHNNGAELDG